MFDTLYRARKLHGDNVIEQKRPMLNDDGSPAVRGWLNYSGNAFTSPAVAERAIEEIKRSGLDKKFADSPSEETVKKMAKVYLGLIQAEIAELSSLPLNEEIKRSIAKNSLTYFYTEYLTPLLSRKPPTELVKQKIGIIINKLNYETPTLTVGPSKQPSLSTDLFALQQKISKGLVLESGEKNKLLQYLPFLLPFIKAGSDGDAYIAKLLEQGDHSPADIFHALKRGFDLKKNDKEKVTGLLFYLDESRFLQRLLNSMSEEEYQTNRKAMLEILGDDDRALIIFVQYEKEKDIEEGDSATNLYLSSVKVGEERDDALQKIRKKIDENKAVLSGLQPAFLSKQANQNQKRMDDLDREITDWKRRSSIIGATLGGVFGIIAAAVAAMVLSALIWPVALIGAGIALAVGAGSGMATWKAKDTKLKKQWSDAFDKGHRINIGLQTTKVASVNRKTTIAALERKYKNVVLDKKLKEFQRHAAPVSREELLKERQAKFARGVNRPTAQSVSVDTQDGLGPRPGGNRKRACAGRFSGSGWQHSIFNSHLRSRSYSSNSAAPGG